MTSSTDTSPRIVVLGSLNMDLVLRVPHAPAAGETLQGRSIDHVPGGKGGNQAVGCARQGADVRMAGAVGTDDFGIFLLAELERGGVDAGRVARLSGIGSGMSVAISDAEGDYGAVIVSGSNLAIDPAGLAEPGLWVDARALILQNEVPDAINVAAARAAKAASALVCLNAAPYRPLSDELAGLVDILVVNAIEAEQMSGHPVADLAAAADAARTLAERFAAVVVTAGGDGLAGVRRGEAPVVLEALPVQLVSTHGAGDTFVGSFVAELAGGAPFAESLARANAAAAAHVSTRQG